MISCFSYSVLFCLTVEVDPDLDKESQEYLEALEQVTEELEQCVNLCKSHIMIVTCFDIGITDTPDGAREVEVWREAFQGTEGSEAGSSDMKKKRDKSSWEVKEERWRLKSNNECCKRKKQLRNGNVRKSFGASMWPELYKDRSGINYCFYQREVKKFNTNPYVN